jgi:hypothetical protein
LHEIFSVLFRRRFVFYRATCLLYNTLLRAYMGVLENSEAQQKHWRTFTLIAVPAAALLRVKRCQAPKWLPGLLLFLRVFLWVDRNLGEEHPKQKTVPGAKRFGLNVFAAVLSIPLPEQKSRAFVLLTRGVD